MSKTMFLLLGAFIALAACGPNKKMENEKAAAPAMEKTMDSMDSKMDSTMAMTYVCPMHADQESNTPGKCTKCGMNMEPKAGHDESSHKH